MADLFVSVPEVQGRTFPCPLPCPRCGHPTVHGLILVNEDGEHMHTLYVCLFLGKGKIGNERCGWDGWAMTAGYLQAHPPGGFVGGDREPGRPADPAGGRPR